MRYTIIFTISIFFCLLFLSCSNRSNRVLQSEGNCPVKMEARTWNAVTGAIIGFELKITNTGDNKLNNCSVIFDHKYKHSLNGLYSINKGLIKDTIFFPHSTYTFQFSGDESNMIYYDIKDDKYIPSEITFESNECSSTAILK